MHDSDAAADFSDDVVAQGCTTSINMSDTMRTGVEGSMGLI
jgi:hypothetical protein